MCNSNQHEPRSGGFTLVELLVVIGIISVLVAILLPALNKAREAAKTVVCLSNVRQIMLGIRMYAHDYHGYLPISHYSNTVDPTLSADPQIEWPGLLGAREYGYIKNPDVFICPDRAAMGMMSTIRSDLHQALSQDNSHRHGINNVAWAYSCYSANVFGAMPTWKLIKVYGYRMLRISQPGFNPSRLLVLTEAYSPDPQYAGRGYWGLFEARPNSISSLWTHGGGVVNCAFLDGHCASMQASILGWNYKTRTWLPHNPNDYRYGYPWYWGVYTNP